MQVSNPVFQFVVYEWLKKFMDEIVTLRAAKLYGKGPKGSWGNIRSFEFFLMGAIAKAVATVLTYPIQLAQSRLRNAKKQKGLL